jgi:hypothetical protein
MKAKLSGAAYDKAAYDARVKSAVAECVRKQVQTGIDFVSDGEQSKPGFFTYVRERLEGFEERPRQKRRMFPDEVAAFPEYYEKYFKEAMTGGPWFAPGRSTTAARKRWRATSRISRPRRRRPTPTAFSFLRWRPAASGQTSTIGRRRNSSIRSAGRSARNTG